MEPWTWEVLAILSAAVLVNTFGFIAWRRDLVGQWYSGAVALATLAMLVGDDYSHWLRASGALVAFLLGLYGFVAWRSRWMGSTLTSSCSRRQRFLTPMV